MTLNELRQSLPNKVGDGKGKQPKDRNAFENLFILQNTLRTYTKEQKDSGNEVDPVILRGARRRHSKTVRWQIR